jgi:hypothetical protein
VKKNVSFAHNKQEEAQVGAEHTVNFGFSYIRPTILIKMVPFVGTDCKFTYKITLEHFDNNTKAN